MRKIFREWAEFKSQKNVEIMLKKIAWKSYGIFSFPRGCVLMKNSGKFAEIKDGCFFPGAFAMLNLFYYWNWFFQYCFEASKA